MTTDYHNLTFFEAAAVFMIAVGIGLVGFQAFIALPDPAQAKISSAMQVLEMSGAAQETWSVAVLADDLVLGGVEDFYHEFYVALGEVAVPVADDVSKIAGNFATIANAFAGMSDSLASNYHNSYIAPGVGADVGGRVMGAYVQKFIE